MTLARKILLDVFKNKGLPEEQLDKELDSGARQLIDGGEMDPILQMAVSMHGYQKVVEMSEQHFSWLSKVGKN